MTRLIGNFLMFISTAFTLNIDGKILCPNGFQVYKSDFSLYTQKGSEPLYRHSEMNNAEFCVSTEPLQLKRGERLVLNIDYTCRMLSKVCSYSDSMKVPMLLKSPFKPRFEASDEKKIKCGRLKFNPEEIEAKYLMFVHP
ncbi:unnamed protein product, partial [Mesorhabditis belari]|uniref:Uncharacterized protein n=1 Tax=Mesorhabditis belari TaxID=2138241 RepID=A0AAF3J5N3_9BILA